MNAKMIAFALDALARRRGKNSAIGLLFTFLVALVASVLLTANALQSELSLTLKALPDITVQKLQGGRQGLIESDRVYALESIPGVTWARERVWGYYYFQNAGVNFTLVGLDFFLPSYEASLDQAIHDFDIEGYLDKDFMLIGSGVKTILDANYYKEYFNFILPDGSIRKVEVAGAFDAATALQSADTVILPLKLARELLALPEGYATDLTVSVANPEEVATIAKKISRLYPDARVITKNDLASSYQNLFDYKSGLFLTLFVTALASFFILLLDKSGMGLAERREIGILRAVGWRMEEVIRLKLLESGLVALSAYAAGIALALAYVFILQAPGIMAIFSGYSILKPAFQLPVVIDPTLLGLIFVATVPLYMAAVIFPSWRAASIDADEVMR